MKNIQFKTVDKNTLPEKGHSDKTIYIFQS